MDSQRRIYFKKQIMKDIEIEKTRSQKLTSLENTSVTVLGSLSYHQQNQQIISLDSPSFNAENNHTAEESQDINEQDSTNHTLEANTNKEEMNSSEETSHLNFKNQNETPDIEEKLPKETQTCLEESKINEINPTFTEIIADKEMDLMRKSLEEDENGADNNNFNLLDNNNSQLENKKSKRCQVKKSYVDFLSDEEDFVWDSSSWKDTGDDSATSELDKPKKKKKNSSEDGKVGNAGLRKKRDNKRKIAKEARDKGHEFLRKNGTIVISRSLNPNPCLDKPCPNNCREISEDKRKSVFDHFWGLPTQRKKDWLIAMTSKRDIKRKRSVESSYRENTFCYFINDGEGRRQVCKKFLMATLDVSNRYVHYTLINASYGSSKEEGRGKIVPKNKTPEEVRESVIKFIKSLPALPSHYIRKDSTRLYLPTEFKNIKNLYRIYKQALTSKGVDVVGEKVFRDIFNLNFNIGFHVPKKDKCLKCLQFEAQNVNLLNFEYDDHLKEKEASKKRLAFHCELRKKNDSILCTSFDLQKVLNTPHGQSMLLFYARKYTVFNLCFYESVTRNGFCYMWGETEGKRGGNEIASILQKYIADVDSRCSVRSLILYSDSCPGQNKNKIVLAAIHNALLHAKHIETIQMNYLLPGHTEMTVDSIHATIENSVRNTIIWAPSQWSTVFQLARKEPSPYQVEVLTHSDFKNFEDLSDKYFKGNLSGKISKVRVATFKKSSPKIMIVKYSMIEDSQEDTITIISRPKALHQKYKTALPLTTAKYNDLKKLCDTGVIPKIFHSEYTGLAHRNGNDTLVETDIEDEVEISPSTSESNSKE